MMKKTLIELSKDTGQIRWFERIANYLASKGRRRMIYREREKIHHQDCASVKNAAGTYKICVSECTYHEPDREKYLERFYILSTSWLGIYLHRFWASDDDGLHDHPWNSVSILLSGCYYEEEPERQNVPYGPTVIKLRKPLHPILKVRSKHAAHRITVDEKQPGAWSLFIRFGLKRRKWGFYRDRGWEAAEVQSRKDEQK
jgi:hypothetical protein